MAECEAVLSECEKAGIFFDPQQSPEILEYTLLQSLESKIDDLQNQ